MLDLDWRPMFWPDRDAAPRRTPPRSTGVTIAIGNRDEVEVAVGTRDPHEAAARLLDARASSSRSSSRAPTACWSRRPTASRRSRRSAVEVVCGLGAGDAFGGALCHRLLAGDDPAEAVRFANAAGAIVAGRLLCADAMPTEDEVLHLLETP